MNEYLLRAIVRLFAIVAKEKVTDKERNNLKAFVYQNVNQDEAEEYLAIFDEFSIQKAKVATAEGDPTPADNREMDIETEEFVEDWANIILICKRINTELTEFQKVILILRLIELIHTEGHLTERQDNLIYYISQTINVSNQTVKLLKQFIFAEEISDLQNKNILIVDDGSEDYERCKHIERPNLTGFLAVLYLSKLENYFIKYVGISNIRLNGITMISRAIVLFPAGSVIRGDKLRPVYYSDVVSRFKVEKEAARISLIAENISLKFKGGSIGLRNIYINEESGRLIGIMGASGSGKSTLTEVLNGKYTPSGGRVLINGIDIHKEPQKLEGLIGYVPQDDLLIEELTVYENLYFAAKLCLDDYSEEEMVELVNKTLQTLGIYDIRDNTVGNPLNKTISGGQRKRLNIGLELLREPSILFLDEPTSGLSSRDSENIMDLLKELALKGKLIFTVIHQPSSDIYKMFDSLIILDVGGYQIYYGNPVEAVVYFRDAVNMVQRDQGSCITCGNVKIEQIFNIIETRVVDEYGQLVNKRKISPKAWSDNFNKIFKPNTDVKHYKIPETTFKIPNLFKQFQVFTARDALAKLKNKQYLVVNFLEAPLLALIIGYFIKYYDLLESSAATYVFKDNPNIPTYFFMSIIVALFLGLSVSGEEIIKDRRILSREKFLDLSRGSYLASKVVVLFTISAIQMISYVIVANYLLEFKGMNLAFWAVLFSSACFANAVGLNISSAFNSVITIYILVPIILIPQLMFNGVAISFEKLNPKISNVEKVPILGELMASKWAYEAIMVHQFKKNKYEKPIYPIEKRMNNAQYYFAYYIPYLNTKLEECQPALRGEYSMEKYKSQLQLIRNEVQKELEKFGEEQFPAYRQLTVQDFDSTVYNETKAFLDILKGVYITRFKKAEEERNNLMSEYTKTEKQRDLMRERLFDYKNDQISEIVKNKASLLRILEYKDRLVRKTTPIYADPEPPRNPMNFRSHYYAPRKYFAGYYFDTFWFNIWVIWGMTIITLIALYFDVLRKIIRYFEKLSETNIPRYVKANRYLFRK